MVCSSRMLAFIRKNSIDVLAGTLAHGILACTVLQVEIDYGWLATLLLTVWIIYAVDHVLDTLNRDSVPLNPRHLPSGNSIRLIAISVAIITDTIFVLSFFTFQEMFLPSVLFCIIIVYVLVEKHITVRNYFKFPKEILIALLYTTGIWMFPVIWSHGRIRTVELMIPVSMMMLALSNTLIYSYFEMDHDKAEKRFSFSAYYGKKTTRRVILCCGLFLIISGVFSLTRSNPTIRMAGIIILLMNIGQVALTLAPQFFQKNYRYGIFNESLFLLPALILLTP